MSAPGPGYNLVHPIYLDVPMMVSFLAHVEGGVVIDEEHTSRQTGARERLLKGRTGARLRFGPFGGADLEGDASAQRRDEDSIESKANRHHTAASLFNSLYEYLVEDGQLVGVERAEDLDALRPGQLVELAGEYLGNPLEEVLALVAAFFPYLLASKAAAAEAVKKAAAKAAQAHSSAAAEPTQRTSDCSICSAWFDAGNRERAPRRRRGS